MTSACADEIANPQSRNRKICVRRRGDLAAKKEALDLRKALLASRRGGAICGEQCFLNVRH
jgi:hypothetical protein